MEQDANKKAKYEAAEEKRAHLVEVIDVGITETEALAREYYARGCEAAVERIKQMKLGGELAADLISDIQCDAKFARNNRQDVDIADFLPCWDKPAEEPWLGYWRNKAFENLSQLFKQDKELMNLNLKLQEVAGDAQRQHEIDMKRLKAAEAEIPATVAAAMLIALLPKWDEVIAKAVKGDLSDSPRL